MARIAQRRVSTLSAWAAWPPSWPAAGHRRSPRRPASTGCAGPLVPASDVLLKGPFTQECKKATGITLKLETVNANDLQSRITSAIQSGSGADIIMAVEQLAAALCGGLADVSDVAEEDRQGPGRFLTSDG